MKIKEKPEDFIVQEIPNYKISKGEYNIYKLKKRLINTEEAIQIIAKKLNIPRKKISYSGAKDRAAVTEQYLSIRGAGKELQEENFSLEFIGTSKEPVSLSDHKGNHFIIRVKDAKNPKQITQIINYFGEQRFSTNNAEIGKALVKKDYKTACELISGGMQEKKIKLHLSERPNDYVGALKKIPLKIITLYIHSYQSLLWNELAEQAIHDGLEELEMVGFGTRANTYNEILKKEKVTIRDFINRQWPEISAEGAKRKLLIPLEDLKITPEKDWIVEFTLPPGAYATEALKQIFAA